MKLFFKSLKTLPFLSVLCLIMAGAAIRIGIYPLLPAFFLIPIYYWIIFRPDWLPLWALFGIGLFYDALMGYELGFSSFLLILTALGASYVRPLLSPYQFPIIWGVYSIYSLGYIILYGLLMSNTMVPLLFSWIYSVVLYPLIAWVLNHLHLRLQSYA